MRTLVYLGLLATIVAAAGVSIYLRDPLKVDVIRDRAAIAREVGEEVENIYRLQIMNTAEQPAHLRDRRRRRPAGHRTSSGSTGQVGPRRRDRARLVPVRVQAPADAGKPGANRIEFLIEAVGDAKLAWRERSTFLFPR